MSKQKTKQHNKPFKLYGLLFLVGLVVISTGGTSIVQASHLNGQINQLQQQNQQSESSQNVLENEAASLSAKIATLQTEIAGLESHIRDNQVKNQAVQKQIVLAEEELAKQKQLLGENIKQMYLEDDISTLEMLATSKDLSDFLDKQAYRNTIQEKIKQTLDKIATLNLELKAQKESLDKLIADQQHMQSQLDSQRAENNRLLSLNQGQQAAIESQIQQNNSTIAELRKQQAAENARLFGATQGTRYGGGYPWGNVAYPSSLVDPWGMYKRECVSYTAWKVANSGRYMPYWGGRGNAKQWDDNARAAGIPVDTNPRAGDVAISNAGVYGHTMYVERIAEDGAIYVSDYNQQFDGNYREYWISAATVSSRGLVFIHF